MKISRFKIYHITMYWLFDSRNPYIQLGLSFSRVCTSIKLGFFEISLWHMHNIHDYHFMSLNTEHESLKKYDDPLCDKLFQIAQELGYEDNRISTGIEMQLEETNILSIEATMFLSRVLSEEELKNIELREDVKFNIEKAKEEYNKLKWYQKFFPQLAPPKIYEN
jgi:hypothetical protein